jgi:branched-subunit amino acid transport protein
MESSLTLWLTILACGIVTFLMRMSFIAIHGRVTMPLWFTRALTFVPVAVLSAMTLPEILIQNNAVNFALRNPKFLAAILAVIVAWRTRNVLATIAVGMAVLWTIQYVVK